MPRVNPWSLRREAPIFSSKTFTDPRFPAAEWTLHLRHLNGCELMLAAEQVQAEINKWLGEDATDAFPLGEGEVRLSESLIRLAVSIEMMQLTPNGEPHSPDDYYTRYDLIGIAHVSTVAWEGILEFANTFGTGDEGNAESADGKS